MLDRVSPRRGADTGRRRAAAQHPLLRSAAVVVAAGAALVTSGLAATASGGPPPTTPPALHLTPGNDGRGHAALQSSITGGSNGQGPVSGAAHSSLESIFNRRRVSAQIATTGGSTPAGTSTNGRPPTGGVNGSAESVGAGVGAGLPSTGASRNAASGGTRLRVPPSLQLPGGAVLVPPVALPAPVQIRPAPSGLSPAPLILLLVAVVTLGGLLGLRMARRVR